MLKGRSVMKIALVVEAASGGTGRHVTDLAGELLRMGHRVDILYSRRRTDPRFENAVRTFSADPHFRSCRFDWTHDLSPSDLAAAAALTRYLYRQGPFDIVHGHSTKAGLLARIAGSSL